MSNYGTNLIDRATLRNPILKHACMGQTATVHQAQVYVMCLLKYSSINIRLVFEMPIFTSRYWYNDAWPLQVYIN